MYYALQWLFMYRGQQLYELMPLSVSYRMQISCTGLTWNTPHYARRHRNLILHRLMRSRN
ncbi:s-adenosylmethionine-dependent methyltransferase [Moniliophthora roreri]|nr:s-adenosylmethionine-dependent methyltransferase [Moniliophthora roreri]